MFGLIPGMGFPLLEDRAPFSLLLGCRSHLEVNLHHACCPLLSPDQIPGGGNGGFNVTMGFYKFDEFSPSFEYWFDAYCVPIFELSIYDNKKDT